MPLEGIREFFAGPGRFRAAVALGLIGVILIVTGVFFFGSGPAVSDFTVRVENSTGEALWRAKVDLTAIDNFESQITNRDGRAFFRQIPVGKEITVSVSGNGFKKEIKKIKLENQKEERVIILRAEEKTGSVKTISFVGPNGVRLDGKLLSVRLSCSSGVKIKNPAREVTAGYTEVTVPEGCQNLAAKVVGTGFDSADFTLDSTNIVKLSALEEKNIPIKATFRDEKGLRISGVEVFVNDSQGVLIDKKISQDGFVNFSLPQGSYKLVAVGTFTGLESQTKDIEVIEGPANEFAFVLKAKTLSEIKVTVLDLESGTNIPAKVFIQGPDGSKSFVQGRGELLLAVTKEGKQIITATSDGFAPEKIEIDPEKDKQVSIKLSRCTAQTCAGLTVKVIDEENLPVYAARVVLLTENGFVDDSYPHRLSGLDGVVKLGNIKKGKYAILAQKYPASARSEVFELDESAEKEIEVRMEIGKGIIEVLAKDPSGKGIGFANAEFFTGSGKSLGKLPLDSEGKGSIELKADKEIFAVFSAGGFTTYRTGLAKIEPGKKILLSAAMSRDDPMEGIAVNLDGIYDSTGSIASSVKPGEYYTAKFGIRLAQNSYEQAGLFVLVGNESSAGSDSFFIDSVNAPLAMQRKGKTYSPPKGSEEDFENLTNEEAKWAEVVWDRDTNVSGKITAEVVIKARESAIPGIILPIKYRAFTVNGGGKFTRDPADPGLMDSENSGVRHGLYAKTYGTELNSEGSSDCESGVCLSVTVLDNSREILLEKPYSLERYGNYNIAFSLSNTTASDLSGAKLRIINSVDRTTFDGRIKFNSIEFASAEGEKFADANSVFEYKNLELGSFTNSRSVNGSINVRPVGEGQSAVYMQVISGSRVVAEKKIDLTVLRAKDLNVSASPAIAPALAEFDLEVAVNSFEEDDFTQVRNALVRVEITPLSRQKIVILGTTNDSGKAIIKIPELLPQTRIKVMVEKPGYAAGAITLHATKNVISIKPEVVKTSLNLTDTLESKTVFTATNLVPIDFTLSKAVFGGRFFGALDEQKMNNYIAQFVERTVIAYNDTAQITALSALSEDAKFLTEKKNLKGKIYVEFENRQRRLIFPFEIPYEAEVSLSVPPKQGNCIEVSLKEWKDATISGIAVAEFFVRNSCINSGDREIDLKDIRAKIQWKSNKLGFVEIALLDTQTSQEARQVLADNVFTTLVENVKGGKDYVAKVYFTPKGGTAGKRAEFSIVIDGSQFTNSGEQLVGASNDIKSEIDIVDLKDCIKINPDPEAGAVIQSEANESAIDFDASACGNMDIDFWLCKDNKNCSGGVEGGILVQPEKFTLRPSSSKKTVVVTRQEIPGIYGVNVDVRTRATNYRQINLVDVMVKPTADDPFELRKYEFSTLGVGTKDSTELTNKFLSENIMVDASMCDWGYATEKGWFDWKYAGIGAIYGALQGIQPAMKAANKAASKAAGKAGDSVKNSSKTQDATSKTNEQSAQTTEQMCEQIKGLYSELSQLRSGCADIASAQTVAGQLDGTLTNAEELCEQVKADNQQTKELDTASSQNITGSADASGAATVAGNAPAVSGISNAQALVNTATNTTKNQAHQTQFQALATQLEAEGTEITTGVMSEANARCEGTLGEDAQACSCIGIAPGVGARVTEVAGQVQSNTGKDIAQKGSQLATTTSTLQNTTNTVQNSASQVQNAASIANTSSTVFSPGAIMGAFTVGGFIVGGLLGGFMTPDACKERHKIQLPDYIINLGEDAGEIESDNKGFYAQYNMATLKIIGQYNKQKAGVIFTNNGVRDEHPVFNTFTFNTKQHFHEHPTIIGRGNSDFGPFRVPDRETLDVQAKLHLKFKTSEVEETLPDLNFDTQSCAVGSKMGRSGTKALPKVKLDWSFSGTEKDSCIDGAAGSVYCDATQFSIMLSKRLNAMREFFEKNPELKCPANPLGADLAKITEDLNLQEEFTSTCYIKDWSGFIEDKPAIEILIEANEEDIEWTGEIPNKQALMDNLHFNSLLIKDGFTQDFKSDFYSHYSDERFFDTPDWFSRLGGSEGHGVGVLFAQNRINFTNRFFQSEQLPGPGTYETLISFTSDDGSFRFFNNDGSPNVTVKVEFYLVSDPPQNSAFYYTPFDGLVGLSGNSLSREGYGVSFKNSDPSKLIIFENSSQPLKSFEDSGSNSLSIAYTDFDTSFYGLNSSPATRGNIFSIEKLSPNEARIRYAPSVPTPVMLKLSSKSVTEDEVSVFYSAQTNDQTTDVGSTLTYWDGAGACLGPQGSAITENFDSRSDRAAVQKDPIVDWQSAYAVDFGQVFYTGDSYIRTIFYTNPLEDYSLRLDAQIASAALLSPDETGQKVSLKGVGESKATLDNVSAIFKLVENEYVCVSDSGRKAEFFWNPKKIYELPGKERNISEFTNSLVAGQTCTGFD